MPACHAGGHEFESRTHRLVHLIISTLTGALVQLVRMPACHAGGHEFESRTHRRKPSRLFLKVFFVGMPGKYCLYVYLLLLRKLSIKMRKMSLNDVFYWLIVCIQSRFSCQQ